MTKNICSSNKKISLEEVYQKVGELLYIENKDILDLVLAVMISRKQKSSKLWLIIIGNSGIGKSEIIGLLDDKEKNTKVLDRITPNTLINGNRDKVKYPDLVPKLKDKVILIPEMASILKLSPEAKAEIYAQLRQLYDGSIGRITGSGVDIRYTDVNVSLIAGSTPNIDEQLLINQTLGTREMLYRYSNDNKEKIKEKIKENSKIDKEKKRIEIRELIELFLNQKDYFNVEISDEVYGKIERWAEIISKLRATASIEWETGELKNKMNCESPTRILEQLIILFRALRSLDEEYSENKALSIIKEIALSSATPIRKDVLITILKNDVFYRDGIHKRDISKEVKISPRTIQGELNVLWHLRILERVDIEMNTDFERYKHTYRLDRENELVLHLAESLDIDLDLNKQGEIENEEKVIEIKIV